MHKPNGLRPPLRLVEGSQRVIQRMKEFIKAQPSMTTATNRNPALCPKTNAHSPLYRSEIRSPFGVRCIDRASLLAAIARSAVLNRAARNGTHSKWEQHVIGAFSTLAAAFRLAGTFCVVFCAAFISIAPISALAADDAAAVEQRLGEVVQHLRLAARDEPSEARGSTARPSSSPSNSRPSA